MSAISAAIASFLENELALNQVVEGDETTTVTTPEGRSIKSISKVVDEITTAGDGAVALATAQKVLAETARTGAETARTNAETAQTEAELAASNATAIAAGDVFPYMMSKAPRQMVISDGTDDAATIPAGNWIDPDLANFTVGAWAYFPPDAAAKVLVYNFNNWRGFQFSMTTGDIIQARIGNGTNAQVFPQADTAITRGFHFIAASFDRAGNALFYSDGVLIGTFDISSYSSWSMSPSSGTETQYLREDSCALGEIFFASGVLTAAQIVAIAKNGTAVGSGLTMLQHLVPQVAGQTDVLLEDISGNNQHALLGTSGLSWVVPLPEYIEPATQALRSDGSAATVLYNTLNGQNPDTGDFAVLVEATFSDPLSTTRVYAALSTDQTNMVIANGSYLGATLTNGLFMTMYGASTGDSTSFDSVALRALFEADPQRTRLMYGRSGSGFFCYMQRSGIAYDITNLFSATVVGAGADWATATVNGTKLSAFMRNSTISTKTDLHGLRLLNYAPTLAQAKVLFAGGNPVGYEKGDKTELTSGTLIKGQAYWIETFETGDDFTNLGGTNVTDNVFVATGTTPTTWSNGSALVAIGETAALDLSDGGGFQPKNSRAENGSSQWSMSTTGITWTQPNRIGKTILASLAASASAQQMTGASVIPSGWEIIRIRAKAASGTPNIIVGNATGGSQIVASEALSTTWKALTLVGGIHIASTTNLWATLSSAVVVEIEMEIQPRGNI